MKMSIWLILFGVAVISSNATAGKVDSERGVIGESVEEGRPVIWKFINEVPPINKTKQLPWLTVVSWKYDGSESEGMPSGETYKRMLALEQAIESGVEAPDFCTHANSRTGNGLKELVYYINDRDAFIERFNAALQGHPRYPIEINFYHDPEWSEFNSLLKRFNKGELPTN